MFICSVQLMADKQIKRVMIKKNKIAAFIHKKHCVIRQMLKLKWQNAVFRHGTSPRF